MMTYPSCEILVVEDDVGIRQALVDLLVDDGYQVVAVMHGQAAWDYLEHTSTLPYLIVLDLMMPVMTGWQFRALQREHPMFRTVPVVVLSALSNRLDPQHLLDLDAVACIGKPINWSQLTQVVQHYCLP